MVGNGFNENPADLLEAHFTALNIAEMQNLPLANPKMSVSAVNFEKWDGHWLGVIVTPWMLNLMLMPGAGQPWPELKEQKGNELALDFPCGPLNFSPRVDPALGSYLCLSLLSPVNQFRSQQEAVEVARQIMLDLKKIPVKNLDEPTEPSRRQLFSSFKSS